MMKNLFNFKKSPILPFNKFRVNFAQDKFGAVYNSEYARFASRQSLEQVYSALYAHRRGLSEHDVEKRRRKFGENIVAHEERTNPIKLFVSAFINPFIGVLTALILISFVLDVVLAEPGEQDWTTIIIISTMVVFSAILRFVQELKAGRSSDALLKMVKNTCYVERTNNESGEIPVEELMPGDIVLLSAGDMIPADLRIVETKDFFVSQSSLTGESFFTIISNKMRIIMKFALICICFFCAAIVMAQKNDEREIEFGMELTSELQATNKGDFNNANLLRLDASFPINRNVCIEAASISTHMTASESIGDDLQTFSNLDAGNIPFAFSVCNMAWQINDRHSLFFGIRNMNEDYFCSDVISFFTNSSCGIFPTISANYPIANYPVASMGIHYKYVRANEDRRFSVQASLYNGAGYNNFTGRENVFRICPKDDGVFGVAEMSYNRGGSYYCIGNALHCNERLSATPWFYTEQHICNNLSLLVGYSHAFTTDTECKDFVGCGVLYLFRKCQLGAFSDYANFVERKECATELTCKIPVFQYLDIQPTLHLITYDECLQCAATVRMTLSI